MRLPVRNIEQWAIARPPQSSDAVSRPKVRLIRRPFQNCKKSFSGCLTCHREIATMKPNLNNQITMKALAYKQNRRPDMARPPAKELTERELEVMHVVWKLGEATATEVRDELARGGLDRAYTTVATLVRILLAKG